jgi:N6-adenosine-specific RNA methylase IME4
VSFLDDFSGYGWIYLVSRKSENEEKFIEFMNLVENQLGKHIKKLCTNGGSKYSGWQCLIDKGNEHQVTPRYTPQWNGIELEQV